MANPAPLLSLLMPTKDRAEYARHAVASVLAMDADDFELVVHDNSGGRELADALAPHAGDARLRYVHAAGPMPMSQNFEGAIAHARGQFVGCLGDDDGVTPRVLTLTRWMAGEGDRQEVDALAPTTPALYYWPGVKGQAAAGQAAASGPAPGELHVTRHTGKRTLVDPERALRRVARSGGAQFFGLPRLYHGVVRRACLERVRERVGRYLPGVSPDMAGAVALASHVRRVCRVDAPLFVPGASPRSGAGRGVQKTHQGDLAKESFLDQQFVRAWPGGVPAYFSGPTMWGAATLQALLATGRQDVAARFNYAALHALCTTFVPSRRADTRASLRSAPRGLVGSPAFFRASYAAHCVWHQARRVGNRLSRVGVTTHTGPQLATIGDAVSLVGKMSGGAVPHAGGMDVPAASGSPDATAPHTQASEPAA